MSEVRDLITELDALAEERAPEPCLYCGCRGTASDSFIARIRAALERTEDLERVHRTECARPQAIEEAARCHYEALQRCLEMVERNQLFPVDEVAKAEDALTEAHRALHSILWPDRPPLTDKGREEGT